MTETTETFVLAAIVAAPIYFDKQASTEKACGLISDAGRAGATLASFGETWLSGYPWWIRTEGFANSLQMKARAEYIFNAIEVPGPETDQLCEAAREAGIDVTIGVVELDPISRASVYCTLLFIGREGVLLGRHRKLKPTDFERRVWSEGDGSSLSVYQRSYARISGLNCWEHRMMLPGYALIAQGTQVHVAVWPSGSDDVLARAFAAQGSCYVISVGGLLREQDIPDRYREIFPKPDEDAGCSIIAPGGNIIASSTKTEETIVTAEAKISWVLGAKSLCDIGGHYSRPDVLKLNINTEPSRRIIKDAQ
ncbi:MAG: carbon-nitrogen hydrolase family protein [bacterium]|nr:carbon-nitrogen hydrolase family protein [bacterium]